MKDETNKSTTPKQQRQINQFGTPDDRSSKTVKPSAHQPSIAPISPGQVGFEDKYGIKGWLAFFMVVFILAALANLMLFFVSLGGVISGSGGVSSVVSLILAPIVAAILFFAASNIGSRKKSARLVVQLAMVILSIASVVSCIVSLFSFDNSTTNTWYYGVGGDLRTYMVTSLIGVCVAQLVVYAIVCAYFQKSQRVKATLVE